MIDIGCKVTEITKKREFQTIIVIKILLTLFALKAKHILTEILFVRI